MKYSAGIYRLIVIAVLFVLPQTALADSSTSVNLSNNGSNSQSNVNVQNSTGGNTICQDGTCTTTGGGSSQTTVCINGQCTTTDGNVAMQSPDGHNKVTVNNTSVSPSVSVSTVPSPTATTSPTPTLQPSVTAVPTVPLSPTMTPDPTIMQMRNDINNQVEKQLNEFKEHMKAQQDSISSFIKSEVQSLQQLFDHLF